MKFAGPTTLERPGLAAFVSQITAIRSASRYGSFSRNTALTTVKIAVFAPMPSARVRTATKVKPGELRSWRIAQRRSFIGFACHLSHVTGHSLCSFRSKRDDRIDLRRAARRQPRRDRDACGKHNDGADPDPRTARRNFRPLMMDDSRRVPCGHAAGEKSQRQQTHPLRRDEADQGSRGRAESEPNSKLAGSPRHLQSEQSINTDRGEEESERAKEGDENEKETLGHPRFRRRA